MTFSIRDIQRYGDDSKGDEIVAVYSKVDRIYGIYGTEHGVMVQFSDCAKLGADQRKLLAPLGPLRGEIVGLIDGWRKGDGHESLGGFAKYIPGLGHDMRVKAELFDRRMADALALALQGGAAEASTLLAAIKADILEERNAIARSEYLLVAGGLFLALIVAISLFTFFVAGPPTCPRGTATAACPAPAAAKLISLNASGFAAALGALGAMFSIALALRSRELKTDLQSRDNGIDAAMRILIGAVSAFVLYCLLSAQYFTFGFGGPNASTMDQLVAWHPGLAVIAFVAGFSERLVGDALAKATLGAATARAAASGAASASAAVGGQTNLVSERNPLGRAPAAQGAALTPGGPASVNDDEETSEGGHSHDDMADDEMTDDVQLPEAVGGVEIETAEVAR